MMYLTFILGILYACYKGIDDMFYFDFSDLKLWDEPKEVDEVPYWYLGYGEMKFGYVDENGETVMIDYGFSYGDGRVDVNIDIDDEW